MNTLWSMLFPTNKIPTIDKKEIAHFRTGAKGMIGEEKYTCKHCGAVSDRPPSEQDPVVDNFHDLLQNQEPLGSEFETIWDDNLTSLYES